jgi:diguanylate cyclase (GGDEF)-like protein/PAS domain S-box-containing protein
MEGRPRASPAPWETEVLEWLPDGVLVIDRIGLIVYANRQAEWLTGYPRGELVGRPVELLVPASLRSTHREHRRGYTARPSPRSMGSADRDFRLRRKNGSEMEADIALGPIGRPDARHIVAAIRDATARRRLECDLEHRALHDPLTGLANRALFFDRLDQAMLGYRRARRPVAIVMLDLDGFKTINDSFGHVAGDEILRRFGANLESGLRSTDTVGRLGGDEFAWILPLVAGREAAIRRVRALLRSVARSYSIDSNQIKVGISAGLALYPDDGLHADELMRHADLALYTAKRQGGGLAFISRPSRGTQNRPTGSRAS